MTLAVRTSCSRPRTQRGRRTTGTAATACTRAVPGRIRVARTRSATTGRSRPAARRRGDDGSSTPNTRWCDGSKANGFDVSYATGVDTDRRGTRCAAATRMFMSVGHDEYWSGGQRANVEAARNAGVHLAFFSGNEIFWKTRWENSIDGSGTPIARWSATRKRTPTPRSTRLPTWTGTWRDPRFSPPRTAAVRRTPSAAPSSW